MRARTSHLLALGAGGASMAGQAGGMLLCFPKTLGFSGVFARPGTRMAAAVPAPGTTPLGPVAEVGNFN